MKSLKLLGIFYQSIMNRILSQVEICQMKRESNLLSPKVICIFVMFWREVLSCKAFNKRYPISMLFVLKRCVNINFCWGFLHHKKLRITTLLFWWLVVVLDTARPCIFDLFLSIRNDTFFQIHILKSSCCKNSIYVYKKSVIFSTTTKLVFPLNW